MSEAGQTSDGALSIKARDLNLWYGDFQALKKLNVDIRQGQITSLIGPVALCWTLVLSFLALAVWILVPNRLEEGKANASHAGSGSTPPSSMPYRSPMLWPRRIWRESSTAI